MAKRAFHRDEQGVAAIEAAFIGSILCISLMNVFEVSRYAYISAQVDAVAQGAAQAAVVNCDPAHSPVTLKCPELASSVAGALLGSSLGEAVTLKEPISEAWYCVSATGGLTQVDGAGSDRPVCPSGGPEGTSESGLYVKITTTYTYDPVFPGLTIASAFAGKIQKTAWMRTL